MISSGFVAALGAFGFLTPCRTHPVRVGGRKLLCLDAPLRYRARDGRVFEVPTGFLSDGASVPRLIPGLVRLAFGGFIDTLSAAILHDWLYQTGRVPRGDADALFWEALREDGEGAAGAWTMWAGVRLGGWWPWWKSRRQQARTHSALLDGAGAVAP